jgi:hypothetical protein
MLIPSFYNLLESLRKNKQAATIVFRTFGADVHDVCTELTRAMIGNQWTHVDEKDICTQRHAQHPNGKAYTAHGVSEEYNSIHMDLTESYFDRENAEDLTMLSGWLNSVVNGRLFTKDGYQLRVKFVHDNYAVWAATGEKASSGKLFFIQTALTDPHHVFFDDNLESEDAHIVAAYQDTAPTEITYEDLVDTYTFRVDPYFAITDADYFIDALQVCTYNRARNGEQKRICKSCGAPSKQQ